MNSQNTKLNLALIGKNIEKSLSPVIHNYFCNQQNIKATYNLIDTNIIDLKEDEIITLFLSNYIGFNITSPLKEKLYNKVLIKDDEVTQIKSINTLAKDKNNNPVGYNTDYYGFCRSVEFLDLTNKNILILGAGGTSRTIIYALKNSNIFVTNRTKDKLTELKKDFNNINLVDSLDKNFLNSIDFLINTTIKNQTQINLISTNDLKLLNKNCIIYDINYQKQDTLLIRESKKIGLQTIDGLSMLMNQAAKSFFHWFKVLPLVTKELNQILLQELK